MIKKFSKKNILLSLHTTKLSIITALFSISFIKAQQVPIQFIDQLPSEERNKITDIAHNLLNNSAAQGTDLYHLLTLDDRDGTQTASLGSYQIRDLLAQSEFLSEEIPTTNLNTNNQDDRLACVLNLLGFGGAYFKNPVDINSALNQYLPEIYIQTVHGIQNVIFLDPSFTDANFAENIAYYDSLSGLYRLIPVSLSDQRRHDLLLEYAFSGKANPEVKVHGLTKRGLDGVRLPLIELIGKFLATKLGDHIGGLEKVIFSGSGFSGAVAQEVAYHLKQAKNELNLSVFTMQAMRYLAKDFAKDYDSVVGWKNVFSVNTDRDWSAELSWLNYRNVYFDCLGQKIRLKLLSPTNSWFTTVTQSIGFWQNQATGNSKGILFKNQLDSQAKLTRTLTKIRRVLDQHDTSLSIEDREFARLVEVMDFTAKTQEKTSSNALATLISEGLFLKISDGRLEHDNLVKIRDIFTPKINLPSLVKLADKASMVLPASYYDPIHKVTITLAYAVGDRSAHDNLRNILDQKDFTQAAGEQGHQLGAILAALHAKTGCLCHGDFHLNNIRFDQDGNAYVIDIETLAHGIIDGNRRDLNGFRDILDLIAKTTSHLYKSSTYGANKGWSLMTTTKEPTETEKAFAVGVLKGYMISIEPDLLGQIKKQYRDFQEQYNSDINRYLGSGFFSTYSSSIFKQVFESPIIEELLK